MSELVQDKVILISEKVIFSSWFSTIYYSGNYLQTNCQWKIIYFIVLRVDENHFDLHSDGILEDNLNFYMCLSA